MNDSYWQERGVRLLGMLETKGPQGEDLAKYLAFVLESWYDEGYKDAVYKVVTPLELGVDNE